MRYIILGKIIGILFVLMVFGDEFIAKKVPKINIDIPLIGMKESRIIIGDKHIHHWLVFIILFTIIIIIKKMKKNIIYKLDNILNVVLGYSFIQILHGLRYKDRFDFSINE